MSETHKTQADPATELTPEQMKMHLSMIKAITEQMMP
jgi:hypothetical protein